MTTNKTCADSKEECETLEEEEKYITTTHLEVWRRLRGLKLDDKVVVGPQGIEGVLGLNATEHFAVTREASLSGEADP